MSFPDRRTAHILLTILLFAVVVGIAYVARTVIVIFCFAVLFAYLIDPVVRFLQRHSLFFKNLRGPHVAEAYVVVLLLTALAVHLLAPGFPGRAVKLVQQLPALSERLSTGEIATDMTDRYGWTDDQALRLKTFLVNHRSDIQNITVAIQESAKALISAVVLIPILAIFFLSEGETLANQVIRLFAAEENQEFLQSLASDLHSMLQHYIRAKVTLGALSFFYVSTALLILRFPHALALGLLAGTLEFIPMAGWIIAAVTIIIVGVLTHSPWLAMAVLMGIWRMLMDYAIAPRVLGHELEIPPLLAIFTLMVGATVGGLPGVYLSLPFVAAIRVVWRRVGRARVSG
jgi:predicted PurR-regulated permease PerM